MSSLRKLLSTVLCAGLPALAMMPAASAQPYGPPGYAPPVYGPYGYGVPPGYGRAGYAHVYAAQSRANPAREQAVSVTISEPQDGAQLNGGEQVTLGYKVVPGPQGDHVHVYVDGEEVSILRELEGSYAIGPVTPGRHELAIKVVNRAHVPIGVESSIAVEVK
ncbi:MAG: hypothetical protein U9Q81_24830 [Pseudomonadota bacterium]|nr:hypothetical protein [Pseudomonadota bacterium]